MGEMLWTTHKALDSPSFAGRPLQANASGEAQEAYAVTAERRSVASIGEIAEDWRRLADGAAEPNYFYGPDFVQAALRNQSEGGKVTLLCSWKAHASERRLIGLMPLTRPLFYWGIPLPLHHSWRNKYGHCSAPLLARGDEIRAARSLLDALGEDRFGASALYLHEIDVEGPAFRALRSVLEERGLAWREIRRVARTIATPSEDIDAFMARSMSRTRRYKLRKARRNLEKRGTVKFELLRGERQVTEGLKSFMAVEKAGWKGRLGSAMGCRASTTALLYEGFRGGTGATGGACARLSLDGRPIAVSVIAVSGDTLWTPKIAYDEAYAKYSPGVLLAMSIVEAAGSGLGVTRIDSASRPESWIEHYWDERLQLADILVATRPGVSAARLNWLARLDRLRREFGLRLRRSHDRAKDEAHHNA
ncbi:GNAT family N-acetyltransferase [Afifella pfennigii]|uniref:GNAT family N-acetyltransferase n=1 Tax=Afifella pfennigii TaxID=209897 RepID=UPI00047D5E8A|nr:GNAT family N-acetyltransferase [Afifella pfennigii]